MARGSGRKGRRYDFLISQHFTPLEARELSTLKKMTPALKQAIAERGARRARFERVAAGKIARGVWSRGDLRNKWAANLSRLYSGRGWRVQEGARGAQQPMPRGSPNPWAMYRAMERIAPPKKDVSPWELRRIFGKTHLERGLIFIQKAERKGGVSASQVSQWIAEKDAAIKGARGQRRAQLIVERNRLGRLLK